MNILILYDKQDTSKELFDLFIDMVFKELSKIDCNFYDCQPPETSYLIDYNIPFSLDLNLMDGFVGIRDRENIISSDNIIFSSNPIVNQIINTVLISPKHYPFAQWYQGGSIMHLQTKLNIFKMNLFTYNLNKIPDEVIEKLILKQHSDLNYSVILEKLNFNPQSSKDQLNTILEIVDDTLEKITRYSIYFPSEDELECFEIFMIIKFLKSYDLEEYLPQYEKQYFHVLQLDFNEHTAAWYFQNKIFYTLINNFNWQDENKLIVLKNYLQKAENYMEEYKNYHNLILSYIEREEF